MQVHMLRDGIKSDLIELQDERFKDFETRFQAPHNTRQNWRSRLVNRTQFGNLFGKVFFNVAI